MRNILKEYAVYSLQVCRKFKILERDNKYYCFSRSHIWRHLSHPLTFLVIKLSDFNIFLKQHMYLFLSTYKNGFFLRPAVRNRLRVVLLVV